MTVINDAITTCKAKLLSRLHHIAKSFDALRYHGTQNASLYSSSSTVGCANMFLLSNLVLVALIFPKGRIN